LNTRVDYIADLIDQKRDHKPFNLFWMPGIFDHRNLLTMILQHEARKEGCQLDNMTFEYTVSSMTDQHILGDVTESQEMMAREGMERLKNESTYFLWGLKMQSGRWDTKMRYVRDVAETGNSVTVPFPVIELQVVKTENAQLYLEQVDLQ